jgi:hypothetical protein
MRRNPAAYRGFNHTRSGGTIFREVAKNLAAPASSIEAEQKSEGVA